LSERNDCGTQSGRRVPRLQVIAEVTESAVFDSRCIERVSYCAEITHGSIALVPIVSHIRIRLGEAAGYMAVNWQ
jgi:hypothetical protein